MQMQLERLRIDKWLWGDRGGRSRGPACGDATPQRDAAAQAKAG